MDIDKIKEAFSDIKKGLSVLGGGPIDYYLDNLAECRVEFFKRCAPFQDGDIVEITKAPNCDNGWASSKHFLNVGRECEVTRVDFRDGKFVADIKPFNQTWFNNDNNEKPVSSPHTFLFSEDSLRLSCRAIATNKP